MKEFLKNKGAGFYVSATAALLSLITLIVYALYATVGNGQQYFSVPALLLLAASILAFGAMCIFRPTAAWAPFVQTVLLFIAFLVYIYACYRYFTEVFYGKVNLSAFKNMNKWFFACLIFFFVSMVLSQVGVHMRQTGKKNSAAAHGKPAVQQ